MTCCYEIVSKYIRFFFKTRDLVLKKSIGQDKYVGAQMNLYNPILEEIIYAFKT
jgi:hypothetical protein